MSIDTRVILIYVGSCVNQSLHSVDLDPEEAPHSRVTD